MTICPKCHARIQDGEQYCTMCGTQIGATRMCTNCSCKYDANEPTCPNCGFPSGVATMNHSKPAKKKKPFPIKAVAIALASIVAVVAIVCGVLFVINNKPMEKKPNYALYIKDREIFYSDLHNVEKDKPWQVTSNFIDTDEYDNDDISYMSDRFSRYCQLSKDGKTIYYIDKITDEGNTLYYRSVVKPDEEPVKIDSDVRYFYLFEDDGIVAYCKDNGENNYSIYEFDLKASERTKVADDTEDDLFLSEDGTKYAFAADYREEETDDSYEEYYTIYLKTPKKEKEKIESDISDLEFCSKDLSTFYFVKDGNLYKKVVGSDKVKILSDVGYVVSTVTDGKFYHVVKNKDKEYSYYDFVSDDYLESDNKMTEPTRPESPSYWDYDDYDAYQAAYDAYRQKYDQYQEAYEAYRAKESRDYVREHLKERQAYVTSTSSLYYFDGESDNLVTDTYLWSSDYCEAGKNVVFSFAQRKDDTTPKVKLSELEYYDQVSDCIDKFNSKDNQSYKISINGVVSEEDIAENLECMSYSKKDNCVYYVVEENSEKEIGTLYKATITDNKLTSEKYDTDVYTSNLTTYDDGSITYYKDFNLESYKGELFLNGKSIDYDVKPWTVAYEDGKLTYFADWNYEKQCGTLKVWKDGEKNTIANDVHDYAELDNGDILFLTDYSTTRYKGELRKYSNGESVKIDEDVVCLLV